MHDYGWTVGVCTHTHDVVGSLLLLAWRSLWSLDGSLLGSLVAGGYRRLEGDGGMHEARNASLSTEMVRSHSRVSHLLFCVCVRVCVCVSLSLSSLRPPP